MMRFVDLTRAYWTDLVPDGPPLASFINTSDDRFVVSEDGSHLFRGFDEIDEHQLGQRLRVLVPKGFFDKAPH